MRWDSNRAIAMDSEGHELRIGDNVKEIDDEVRLFFNYYTFFANPFNRDAKGEFYTRTSRSSPSCTTATSLKTVAFSLLAHGRLRR